jgi:imidazolonepropionase-like amidohydrolase
MTQFLLTNARIFDGVSGDCPEGMSILVEDGLIREVSGRAIAAPQAAHIDVGGRTVMPGLIDAHVHAYASDANVQKIDQAGEAYRTAHAVRMLGHALDCGFTTVRDIGGGDFGLARAIQDRLIRAPRFFYAGKALSMTGGHGDLRGQNDSCHTSGYCSCGQANSICVIADGVDGCIKAVREELRRGAHCIKIMASGGVASPTDPLWMNQYREDEIRAIVNETSERRTYTAAHCHPAEAIRRCVAFGVRSIEHGTLIDEQTAQFAASKGAFIVPTMAVIFSLRAMMPKLGLSQAIQEKLDHTYRQALSGMDIMRKAGVKVCFGTDLLGPGYIEECREFAIRREVFSPLEIMRQATSTGAALLLQEDKLGCVKPGAFADLLVVDGDPLKDIGLLAEDGRKLALIMRGGEIVKDTLGR